MKEMKDSVRSRVRVGFDRRVYKEFRGTNAEGRYENEIRILRHLEDKECGYVPRVLDTNDAELLLVTSNCGAIVEKMSEGKQKKIFESLEVDYGVRHDDPFLRNITYSDELGCFCVIDFELAEIVSP